MKWPLTTRGRLDDAQATIARLERDLAELKHERKRLTDFITVKSAGMSVYGEIQVPREEEEPEPRQYSPEKDSAEPMVVKPEGEDMLPRRARDIARRAEKVNLEAAAREQAIADRATQAERERQRVKALVDAELGPVVEEGIKAATNGNH